MPQIPIESLFVRMRFFCDIRLFIEKSDRWVWIYIKQIMIMNRISPPIKINISPLCSVIVCSLRVWWIYLCWNVIFCALILRVLFYLMTPYTSISVEKFTKPTQIHIESEHLSQQKKIQFIIYYCLKSCISKMFFLLFRYCLFFVSLSLNIQMHLHDKKKIHHRNNCKRK